MHKCLVAIVQNLSRSCLLDASPKRWPHAFYRIPCSEGAEPELVGIYWFLQVLGRVLASKQAVKEVQNQNQNWICAVAGKLPVIIVNNYFALEIQKQLFGGSFIKNQGGQSGSLKESSPI